MATTTSTQPSLFALVEVPSSYRARPAPLFQPQKIVLAKGSVSTAQRRQLVEGVCAVYPKAEVVEQLSTPHNKIRIEAEDALEGVAVFLRSQGRVDDRRFPQSARLDRVRLVFLQGDQRRNDRRRSFAQRPRNLVDGRFARPGRLNQQSVPALEKAADRVFLPGTQ